VSNGALFRYTRLQVSTTSRFRGGTRLDLELAQGLVGAFQLSTWGVARVFDQRELAKAGFRIGAAKHLPSWPAAQPLAGVVQQLGVGGEGNRLGPLPSCR
jgi:hypothetical protein